MTPRVRKLALTAHVTFSVGWLGAVMAYLSLAITGLTSADAHWVRAAYLGMHLLGWSVIVPCSLLALLTGLVESLGTEWGVFRHSWIVAKLVLTVGGVVFLLLHMPTVSRMSRLAMQTTVEPAAVRIQLVVHAAVGLLLLLAATALSVFKPWGRTRYGMNVGRGVGSTAGTSEGLPYGPIAVIALVLLFVILHVLGGGLRRH